MSLTTTEILELIRAGYTKAEIDTMVNAEGSAKQTAEQETTPAKENRPESVPDEKPETGNKPDSSPETPGAGSKVETEVEKLVNALGMRIDRLAQAVISRNIGGIEGTTMQETADDIIARIINPHIGEGGK